MRNNNTNCFNHSFADIFIYHSNEKTLYILSSVCSVFLTGKKHQQLVSIPLVNTMLFFLWYFFFAPHSIRPRVFSNASENSRKMIMLWISKTDFSFLFMKNCIVWVCWFQVVFGVFLLLVDVFLLHRMPVALNNLSQCKSIERTPCPLSVIKVL